MALPTGPISRVAYDEIIAEEWGDSVAQSLNNLSQFLDQAVWPVPTGSEFLAPIGPGAVPPWFVVGGDTDPDLITVPDWAHHVLARWELNGVQLQPASPSQTSYILQGQVGPADGRGRVRRFTGRSGYFHLTWTDYMPCDALAGDRTLKVFSERTEGSGQFKINAESDISVQLMFQGAVDWYPGL